MAKKDYSSKMNIPMILACVLLCLTMFSIHLSSGIYARYTTTAEGRDGAWVASFGELSISESGSFDSGSAMMIPGVSLEKDAAVSFSGAEVAVEIIVEAEVSKEWLFNESTKTFSAVSGKVTWAVADNWVYKSTAAGQESNVYTFSMNLAPKSVLTDEKIIKDSVINVGADITQDEMPDKSNIYFINFKAKAIQMD